MGWFFLKPLGFIWPLTFSLITRMASSLPFLVWFIKHLNWESLLRFAGPPLSVLKVFQAFDLAIWATNDSQSPLSHFYLCLFCSFYILLFQFWFYLFMWPWGRISPLEADVPFKTVPLSGCSSTPFPRRFFLHLLVLSSCLSFTKSLGV